MSALAAETVLPLHVEAIEHARAMVRRFEMAVATHPPCGPLTVRQQADASDLDHWRRRNDLISDERISPR